MNKKGQESSEKTLFVLFEIVLVLVCAAAIGLKVNDIRSNHVFENRFFAKDMALMLDALGSISGNAFFVYSSYKISLSDFVFDLSPNAVRVGKAEHPVAENTFISYDVQKIEHADSVVFAKQGSQVRAMTDLGRYDVFALDCPQPARGFPSVLLDAGHGFNAVQEKGDDGFVNSGVKESESAFQVAVASERLLKSVVGVRKTKDVVDDAKTYAERIVMHSPNELLVSIHLSNNLDKSIVKAFVRAGQIKETTPFACRIINELTGTKLFSGSSIVPVDAEQLSSASHFGVLKSENPVVVLEIGSVFDASFDAVEIANALRTGIASANEAFREVAQ